MDNRVRKYRPLRVLAAVVATLAGLMGAPAAQAQDSNPPEILTSELTLKTVLETDRLEVNFVIVDADKVTEVTIDGKPQAIEPADTVMITRTFVFREPVTRVRVTAKDEAGHSRTVVYTVYQPGADPDLAKAKRAPAEGRWFGAYDARIEYDSNPSNDLSSPITIEGVKLTGVVPDDQQADTRLNLYANGGYTKGNLTGYAGASVIDYSKDANKPFELLVVFLGGIYAMPQGDTAALEVGYTYSDIYVGGNAYVQTHTVSPGYRTAGAADDGGTEVTLYGLDLTYKVFAVAGQDSTAVYKLKWDYTSTDAQKQDRYDRRIRIGTESEGLDDTKYAFLSADWDWKNAWDSGMLWDIGVGLQYRSFATDEPLSADTPLGAKRVDAPMRISTGLGWKFSPSVRLMADYEYLFNLSNKSPYVRQTLGVGVNGTF